MNTKYNSERKPSKIVCNFLSESSPKGRTPNIHYFPSIVKYNVFAVEICKYALSESSEGISCVRRKLADPCHPASFVHGDAAHVRYTSFSVIYPADRVSRSFQLAYLRDLQACFTTSKRGFVVSLQAIFISKKYSACLILYKWKAGRQVHSALQFVIIWQFGTRQPFSTSFKISLIVPYTLLSFHN